MIVSFFRNWYTVVAMLWLLFGLVGLWALLYSPSFRAGPLLLLMLVLALCIVPAVLMGTRGFRHTTVLRMFVWVYLVALIPTGLLSVVGDIYAHKPESHQGWPNVWVWLNFAVEVGLLASPLVFGFAAGVTYLNNLVAKD